MRGIGHPYPYLTMEKGFIPPTLIEGVSLGNFDVTSIVSKNNTTMTRENLKEFEKKSNVTKITSDNGSVSYLTSSSTFADETNRLGACKLNTVENEKKHVLFLFNSADAEVGRYYLGSKLQGKTPAELVAMKKELCFFLSYNPNTKQWVPCVGKGSGDNLASSAVSF